MFISLGELINKHNIKVKGVLHVGAHECEELNQYAQYGFNTIYWVEGQEILVHKMKQKGIKHIYHALIDSEDNKEVTFHISNNGQSSSILELGTHLKHHPDVHYISSTTQKTTRLDTLIEKNNIPIETLNFINIDIQGIELRALKSMEKYLKYIDYIYTEVNSEEVYKECDLIGSIDSYLKQFGFQRCAVKFLNNCGWGDAFYMKIRQKSSI